MIFKGKGTKPKTVKVKRSGAIVRKVLAIVFLALTVFLGFYVIPYFYEQKANTGMIVVAAADISRGDVIASNQISVKEIGIYGLSGYYTDIEAIIGMVAVTDIKKSDIVLDNKISPFEKSALLALANDTRGLLTITVRSNAAGLASHLKSGAIVNVYNITADELDSEGAGGFYTSAKKLIPVLNPLLENLEIYSIENSNAERVGGKSDGGAENSSAYSSNANIVSTITFYTESKEQEIELLKAEYDGMIHIALVEL